MDIVHVRVCPPLGSGTIPGIIVFRPKMRPFFLCALRWTLGPGRAPALHPSLTCHPRVERFWQLGTLPTRLGPACPRGWPSFWPPNDAFRRSPCARCFSSVPPGNVDPISNDEPSALVCVTFRLAVVQVKPGRKGFWRGCGYGNEENWRQMSPRLERPCRSHTHKLVGLPQRFPKHSSSLLG